MINTHNSELATNNQYNFDTYGLLLTTKNQQPVTNKLVTK